MNKVLGVLLLGLSANFLVCSDKATASIPRLQDFCKKVVETDYNMKVRRAFDIINNINCTESDSKELKDLLSYNEYVQKDLYIQANIQLPSLVATTQYCKWTLLHKSAYFNRDENTQQLLVAHANVNARDQDGCTPLHLSVNNDAENTTAQLLVAGADVNARNKKGCTPLHYSTYKYCVSFDRGEKPMKLLFAHGADVNVRDNTGKTPLHYAALYNEKKRIQLLLTHGASVLIRDNNGKTPLTIVRRTCGASVLIRDNNDKIPLLMNGPEGKSARKIEAAWCKHKARKINSVV